MNSIAYLDTNIVIAETVNGGPEVASDSKGFRMGVAKPLFCYVPNFAALLGIDCGVHIRHLSNINVNQRV